MSEKLSDRLLHTEKAQKAYLNSPLFKTLVAAVRANEERMDGVSLLGLLLAELCLGREDWIAWAVRRVELTGHDPILLSELVQGCRCRATAWTNDSCAVHGRAGPKGAWR